MKNAFMFPGQGSQFIGMGKDLADNFKSAREVFEEVNSALSEDLFKIMTEGTAEQLGMTENTQPALMAHSMAVVRVLEKEFGIDIEKKISFVMGHSLGEYSACCAAGVFSLEDTAKLLKLRGRAMQKAVAAGEGGMAAVLGMSFQDVGALVEACVSEDSICVAANDNSDGQVVLSGHMKAIDKAVKIALEFGAKKCIKLPVSIPAHSPLMQPAADVMIRSFMEVEAKDAKIAIIPNTLVEATTNKTEIIKRLIEQVTGSVRFRETQEYLKGNGVVNVAEIGPGKVLSGIVKRAHRDMNVFSTSSIEEIEEVAKMLNS